MATNSGNGTGEPLCCGANCSGPENPEGAGQIETTAPGRVCQTVAKQTLISSSREKPNNSRDKGLEKRKREMYFRCQHRRVGGRYGGGGAVRMYSAHDHGQGRGCFGCGLLGIHSTAVGAFLVWRLECSSRCQCPKKIQ